MTDTRTGHLGGYGKSRYNHKPTKNIRVPEVFARELQAIASAIDSANDPQATLDELLTAFGVRFYSLFESGSSTSYAGDLCEAAKIARSQVFIHIQDANAALLRASKLGVFELGECDRHGNRIDRA